MINIARRLMKFKIVRWFMQLVLPRIRFSNQYARLHGNDFYAAYLRLRPGDFILSVDKSKLSTYLIPGYWSHAAVCVGIGTVSGEVAEMVSGGYQQITFFDFCKESDEVCIIRPWANKEHAAQIVFECQKLKWAKYDLEFEHSDDEYYCSELCYASDKLNKLKIPAKEIIQPDDIFYSAIIKGAIIFRSKQW